MTDDDVVALLDRAAGLAPERLDREPVAEVARRRGRRRTALGGAALAAVVGLGVVVVPGGLGTQEVLAPAAQDASGTQFFALDLPVNDPSGEDFGECLPLAGAGLVSAPMSLSATAVVSAVGTAEQRAALEQCLRSAATVTEVDDADLRAVTVSATGSDLGPLAVTTSWTYPWMQQYGRVHDLVLTNTSDETVFVRDPGFGQVVDDAFVVGTRCTAARYDGALTTSCRGRYELVELAPGQGRSFPVTLSVDPQRPRHLPVGAHEVRVDVAHRTTGAFRDGRDTAGATLGTVLLRYDVSAAG